MGRQRVRDWKTRPVLPITPYEYLEEAAKTIPIASHSVSVSAKRDSYTRVFLKTGSAKRFRRVVCCCELWRAILAKRVDENEERAETWNKLGSLHDFENALAQQA